MVGGLLGMTLGSMLIPLAPGGAVLAGAAFLIVQQLVGDASGSVYGVVEQSVTQSIVDDRILGRVNATVEFVTTVTALAGSVVGGVVAELFGLRAALAIGVLGGAASVLIVWFSPARQIREMPNLSVSTVSRVEDLPLTE
jgi:MFS family permease